MIEMLVQLAPLYVFFAIGVILRQCALADKAHGYFLLKLVFCITLPALVLTSLPSTEITLSKILLPFANIAVSFACMLMALLLIKAMKFEKTIAGNVLVNTMLTNSLFMLPFILLIYGEQGFADAVFFGTGNALIMGSYVYVLAKKYEGKESSRTIWLSNIIKSPLLWSIAIAIAISIAGFPFPSQVQGILNPLAQLTSPLILIAMGTLVSFNFTGEKKELLSIAVRMLLGALFGVSISAYLGLEGSTFIVASLCAGAPIALNGLSALSRADLESDSEDMVVSVSILLGLIFIPALIMILGQG